MWYKAELSAIDSWSLRLILTIINSLSFQVHLSTIVHESLIRLEHIISLSQGRISMSFTALRSWFVGGLSSLSGNRSGTLFRVVIDSKGTLRTVFFHLYHTFQTKEEWNEKVYSGLKEKGFNFSFITNKP